MSDNVIPLPRHRDARPTGRRLGLYLRVGRNQHHELLEVLSGGERDFHGIVIDAGNADRHSELRTYALQSDLDVVLDPKTHAMALPGGYNAGMASLPWGLNRPHNFADFENGSGRIVAQQIADFAEDKGFTQVLGPTHLLSGPNDRWLRRDIESMGHLKHALDARKSNVQLIYPAAFPMKVLRDRVERSAVIAALADAPMDALWLRIENFGSDATGEKTVAYIEAAREFGALGVPVIADHAGGLSGLGLLAFGAVGGVAHGITLLESFKPSNWRRPPDERRRSGIPPTRVYVPRLDMHLKAADAEAFLGSSTRARGRYGCRDTHCCPSGIRDMLSQPTRHFVHQRIGQIAGIASTPQSLRAQQYIEQNVRTVSDDVSAAVSLGAITDELRSKLQKKQKLMGRFRKTVSHFAEGDSTQSVAQTPQTRMERSRAD